eukprot:9422772-Alexandrium_andersonii.AAC.1
MERLRADPGRAGNPAVFGPAGRPAGRPACLLIRRTHKIGIGGELGALRTPGLVHVLWHLSRLETTCLLTFG